MSYLNTHARTASPTKNDLFQPTGRAPTLFGVFLGFVKDTKDVQKNGRIRVWIPEFGSSPENQDGWIIANYCSPFAGATNVETADRANVEAFDGTQTSYGMWMIPPDINNQVLLMFINGDPGRAIWIGCMYNQFMNSMVPGMAGSENNYQYQGKYIPVAEYNKWDPKATNPDDIPRPYEATKFKGLGNQGLINDFTRGVSDSSARRESPSMVFGIVTPGPVINKDVPVANYRRKGGSAFIMDDATGSESVVLTTKSGAQIKLDETNGYVYLINRDGTAWVQMDQKGNVDIFGATNVSMRAQKDFNIRADRNINIEAGQNVYIKAAKDTTTSTTSFTYDVNNIPKPSTIPYYKYVGEGLGEGGNIVMQALNNTHTTIKNNEYLTIGKNQEIKVGATIDISAATEYNLTAPSIKNVGAVKIRGTLDVTGATTLGNTLGVNLSINGSSLSLSGSIVSGDISGQNITGYFPQINNGSGPHPGSPGGGGSAGPAVSISTPPAVVNAEIKPLIDKINILATWDDPTSKFKRNAESMTTTVSIMPTYEPCPEHEKFSLKAIKGYTPRQSEGAKTYEGSGGAGNEATSTPADNTDPGANNTELPPPDASDNVVSKDFNMAAYQCQLKIHEGVKYISYIDSVGLPTAGIGHLLRTNERAIYWPQWPSTAGPGVIVSEPQVTSWFNADAPISIGGAQRLIGTDTWGDLSDIRKRACADLCYNMGENRLSKFKRFIAGMKAKDYNLAGASLRDSKWFTQVGRRGPNIINMIVNNVDPNGCDRKFPPV